MIQELQTNQPDSPRKLAQYIVKMKHTEEQVLLRTNQHGFYKRLSIKDCPALQTFYNAFRVSIIESQRDSLLDIMAWMLSLPLAKTCRLLPTEPASERSASSIELLLPENGPLGWKKASDYGSGILQNTNSSREN